MPASQAGRRGFDPRLPLHLFNNLGSILELSLLRLLRCPSASQSTAAFNELMVP